MEEKAFALFVDVMGVQRQLLTGAGAEGSADRFEACREQLESFRRDLAWAIEALPWRDRGEWAPPVPSFVAEFSDAAYVIGSRFASVAEAAVLLMRQSLRHRYPLRGGIGFGSFSHETSGVRTGRDKQVWSTSSFLGGAVVTAYQAERSPVNGLRILVHPTAMAQGEEPLRELYTLPLVEGEPGPTASHEVRFWEAGEADAALRHLGAFQDAQELTDRAKVHYAATNEAYRRFGAISDRLRVAGPDLWLWNPV